MINLFWFRRDLRLHDNAGLYHALRGPHPVLPIFIFDTEILEELSDRKDARVTFLHQEISRLHAELEALGSTIEVWIGKPREVWKAILEKHQVADVYVNRDYEPTAKSRDESVGKLVEVNGGKLLSFKDQVVFEGNEILKDDGNPYVVFTPYSRKWKAKLEMRMDTQDGAAVSFYLKSYPNEKYFSNFHQTPVHPLPDLSEIDFEQTEIALPSREVKAGLIKKYDQQRDFPAIKGTSRLGIHFRFGTISIRDKALRAGKLNATYLSELIWRDFYSQILQNYPHVVEGPFREAYAHIPWRNDEKEFEAWCAGKTGYPMVDAGMRELNTTGFMHNRVRMVTASFLTKHLMIDWRWGEAYFAEKLLDFDLASNNGGWQWAAGCGTDAAPYFRIFNPESQLKKFDKQKEYVKHWVPEFGTDDYPEPVVDHRMARERCLRTYKEALEAARG